MRIHLEERGRNRKERDESFDKCQYNVEPSVRFRDEIIQTWVRIPALPFINSVTSVSPFIWVVVKIKSDNTCAVFSI